MPSPFPGMDPFIEACDLWGDFHDSLISAIKGELVSQLPERYVVRIRRRSNVEFTDPVEGEVTAAHFEPDVAVRSAPRPGRPAATAVAEEDTDTLVMHGLLEEEDRELFLDILEADPRRKLVTSIEILSPSNKRPDSRSWHLYLRKRQVFLQGNANLVEIDLLRGGQRFPMEEPWPASPYTLLVLRKDRAPECTVKPAFSLTPLSNLAVPLARPDPDIVLPLQSLVDAVYQESRYDSDIDYHRTGGVRLTAEEKQWLAAKLSEQEPA